MTKWSGSTICDVCKRPAGSVANKPWFVDGKTDQGPWAWQGPTLQANHLGRRRSMDENSGIDNGSLMEAKAREWREAKRTIKGLTQEEARGRIDHIQYALHHRAQDLKAIQILIQGEVEAVDYLQKEFLALQRVLTPVVKVKLKTKKKPSASMWAEAQGLWDSLTEKERDSIRRERKRRK